MPRKKSAAQAATAVEKQARAKKSPARKSKGGELDRRESKFLSLDAASKD